MRTRLHLNWLEDRVTPNTYTVNAATDSGTGSGLIGDLRYCVTKANGNLGADTITFNPTFFASAKTITLTSGEILITEAVSIIGPGAALATISGNKSSRIVNTTSAPVGAPISISGLTLTGGMTTGAGGAIFVQDETLSLTNCVVSGNSAAQGGGLYVSDTFSITGCAIFANSTTASNGTGGGIRVAGNLFATGAMTILNSTIANNTAISSGGGIALSTNTTLVVQNCTLTGNTAGGGLGGGGIANTSGTGTISLESTIDSGNTDTSGNGQPDLYCPNMVVANFCAVGSKVGAKTFSGDASTTALLGQALNLGLLQNNGGPTQTMLPAANSPVINKGSNPASLTADQRGAPAARNSNGGVDIGAVERQNFLVTNINDSGAGSLRQAVLDANALTPSDDSISFDTSGVFAAAQTIVLTTGQLLVSDSVTFNGSAAQVSISGNNNSRILNINGTGTLTVTLNKLILRNAFDLDFGGAIVDQDEALTLNNCSIINNASFLAPGIRLNASGASLTVNNSTISNNTAPGTMGGGIDAAGASTITITNSTIANNSAGGGGGGLEMFGGGNLTITGSTFSGNNTNGSANGGGMELRSTFSTLLIQNSTISGNSSGSGGGIALYGVSGTLNVRNTTITNNSASTNGGGIARTSGTASITCVSTIISGDTATVSGPDIFTGGPANLTDCLLGNSSGITTPVFSGSTASLVGKAANLGPLADNGGPTQTHFLLSNSPAIGQGSNPAPAVLGDQRGRPRAFNNVDIGAVEVQQAARVLDLVIGDGTAQRSTVRQIRIAFSWPVEFVGTPAAAFSLVRQSDSMPVSFIAIADNSGPGTIVTLNGFAGGATDFTSLADGRYTLTSLAAQFGAEGLDGNNDGMGGDNYQLVGTPANGLFRLFGDSDGNGTVNAADFLAFRSAFGGNTAVFDFNNNGSVDSSDFLAFRSRFGSSV